MEIIADYTTEPFEAREPLILISIGETYNDEFKSIYEAVRGVWRIAIKKTKKFKLVLAHHRGLVVGAFRPSHWLPATRANFPSLAEDLPRIGFVGQPAEETTSNYYIRKRIPDKYRTKGASNPIRLIEPLPTQTQSANTEGERQGRWTTKANGVVPLGVIVETEDHTTPENLRRAEENAKPLERARSGGG